MNRISFCENKRRIVLVVMLSLVAVVAFINDHYRRAFRLIVEAALPILLAASLSVAEVSESVEYKQMLTTSFRWFIVNASETCRREDESFSEMFIKVEKFWSNLKA